MVFDTKDTVFTLLGPYSAFAGSGKKYSAGPRNKYIPHSARAPVKVSEKTGMNGADY
ncbi:hypothetical protein J6590_039565 [Homalodisca vitripennis]|nr:hypothetical protein J6590_039565 [Homalodisca vitripennis]